MTAAAHRHTEIARRYKAKRAQKPRVSITTLRIRELDRLFTARYGHTLPNDDAGRDDIVVMAHHLARCPGEPARRIRNWIELRMPWMTSDVAAEIICFVMTNPIKWRADTLAQRLRLTEAERRRLGIRTIGAIDMTKEERKQARRLRQRQRDLARRRAQRARPRAEYEANSISRNKPWLALGISRRTWYRRRGTSARAVYEASILHADLCHCGSVAAVRLSEQE
ncbi:MAG: hypothetical protein ACLQNV_14480 [Steroidobacteraceae bacterium]